MTTHFNTAALQLNTPGLVLNGRSIKALKQPTQTHVSHLNDYHETAPCGYNQSAVTTKLDES